MKQPYKQNLLSRQSLAFIIVNMMASTRIMSTLAFSSHTLVSSYTKKNISFANSRKVTSFLSNYHHIPSTTSTRTTSSSSSISFVRLFSSSTNDVETKDKARLVFLGTPEVAADSLKTIVEESKKEDRYVGIFWIILMYHK